MTGQPWHLGPMCGFDLETTGVDVEADRVVTAAITRLGGDLASPAETHLLCDPGVPIPEGAAAIHGITTERAQAEGIDVHDLLATTTHLLADAIRAGIPIVGMNLAYDFTLLDRECRRHDMASLDEMLGLLDLAPILDVIVIDKRVDQYRKGSRKLTAIAAHYGVVLEGAHDAAHDTLAACRVAWKIGRRAHLLPGALRAGYRALGLENWQIDKIAERLAELRDLSLTDLHWAQARWRADQSSSLEAHLRRTDAGAVVDPWWPVKPYQPTQLESEVPA